MGPGLQCHPPRCTGEAREAPGLQCHPPRLAGRPGRARDCSATRPGREPSPSREGPRRRARLAAHAGTPLARAGARAGARVRARPRARSGARARARAGGHAAPMGPPPPPAPRARLRAPYAAAELVPAAAEVLLPRLLAPVQEPPPVSRHSRRPGGRAWGGTWRLGRAQAGTGRHEGPEGPGPETVTPREGRGARREKDQGTGREGRGGERSRTTRSRGGSSPHRSQGGPLSSAGRSAGERCQAARPRPGRPDRSRVVLVPTHPRASPCWGWEEGLRLPDRPLAWGPRTRRATNPPSTAPETGTGDRWESRRARKPLMDRVSVGLLALPRPSPCAPARSRRVWGVGFPTTRDGGPHLALPVTNAHPGRGTAGPKECRGREGRARGPRQGSASSGTVGGADPATVPLSGGPRGSRPW